MKSEAGHFIVETVELRAAFAVVVLHLTWPRGNKRAKC